MAVYVVVVVGAEADQKKRHNNINAKRRPLGPSFHLPEFVILYLVSGRKKIFKKY